MLLISKMNQKNLPTPKALDKDSLRGLLFLSFFGTLIAAKCSASEALRLYYEIDISSALFIWLPSLLIGGAVCLLYVAGPGSAFSAYWKSKQFLLPAGLIWLTIAFSIVRQLPSVIVPGSLSVLLAAASFVLGHFVESIPVKFLAAVWLFGAVVCFLFPPVGAYSLFAILLIAAGAIPAGIGTLRIGKASQQ